MYPASPHPTGRDRLALLIQVIALLIVIAWWLARAIPYPLKSQPESASTQQALIPCVSYSPFRHREGRDDITPFNYRVSVTASQIETDLRILKTQTNCIRTYGLAQGLDLVPAVVRKLGMRMRLGIWLTSDEAQNQLEVDRGIALAHQFKDVVDILIVGNEVLLRRELSAQALGKILTYANDRASVPITYADVWEFWIRNASLSSQVDLVTVHILPYWEDEPVAVSDAVDHVFAIASKVAQQFPGKPIWVGETGWPAAGRQRAGAVPGKVEQSLYVSELLSRANSSSGRLSYNVIEGFDQPWKRSFEGAMGGYWGLFDQFGEQRVQLSGFVVEDVYWWRGPLCALIVGLLAMVVCRIRNEPMGQLTLAFALLGALIPLQWLMMSQWDRNLREQAASLFLALLSAGFTLTVLPIKSIKINEMRRKVLLVAAATAALVLLLDPRYRPFAWWWFFAPTVALLVQCVSFDGLKFKVSNEERVLVFILASCAILIIVAEGWRNLQAVAYAFLLLTMSWSLAWPCRVNTMTESRAANAQSSVV